MGRGSSWKIAYTAHLPSIDQSFSASRHRSMLKVPKVVAIANSLGDRLEGYGDLLHPKKDLLQIWICEEGICLIISDACSPCDGKSTRGISIEITTRVSKNSFRPPDIRRPENG